MFKIFDWAGNELTAHGRFKTFEDAWDYILGDMTDALALTEDDYQEYFVDDRETRETRFLEPNDIRNGMSYN